MLATSALPGRTADLRNFGTNAPLRLRAGRLPRPKVADLRDTFSSLDLATLDTWAPLVVGGTAGAISNGSQLVQTAVGGFSSAFIEVIQFNRGDWGTWDLRDSQIVIQVVSRTSDNGHLHFFELVGDHNNPVGNKLQIAIDSGYKGVAEFQATWANQEMAFLPTFDRATMGWLRLRESAGVFYWEYGPAAAGPWTILFQKTTGTLGFPVTDMVLAIAGGYYAGSTDSRIVWDNLNVTPYNRSSVAPTVGRGLAPGVGGRG